MKKLLFMSFLSLLIISCNNEEKPQEQQTTTITETLQETPQEQPAENTEEVYDDSIDGATKKLEEELTEFYKNKGIKYISVGAYSKGTEAILYSDGKTEVSEEEFKKYALDIANLVRKVRETPEAVIKVYLQLEENGEYKDIYTGEF